MDQDFEYGTVEKMLLAQAAKKKSPANGGLELTPLCNMNCDMCYVRLDKDAVDRQGGLRSLEEWLSIARQMKDAGVLFLLLTGGEPLTYPYFKELYLELQKMGMIVVINTNGTLIDEEWAKFFGENKPRRINITLYGKDNQTYKELCHLSDGYNRTINGIKLLKKYNVDVKMNCSVTRRNADEMDDIVAMSHELDVPITIDTYMVAETRERDMPYDIQSRLNPKDAAAARIKALRENLEAEEFDQYARAIMFEGYNLATGKCMSQTGVTCYAGNCSFMITWKGIMKPCVVMEDIEADVLEVGFDAAWKHIVEETEKLRINSKCATCPYRPACRTCAACAKAETGAHDGISEYICEYGIETVKLLKDYLDEKKV